jgi:lysine 2,3-aminomutase
MRDRSPGDGGETVRGIDPVTRIPYSVSRYYAGLARGGDPDADPIAAQFMPRDGEQVFLPRESSDPIGDRRYLVTERLVHHYPDRALLLVNDRCATYCRFCFRRHFTGHGGGPLTRDQLEDACEYLGRHPGIREILLSGGDPLVLADEELAGLIGRLHQVGSRYIIRVCTRVPVVLPSRVTPELARMLSGFEPLWVVIHANHPWELTDEFRAGIRRLRTAGIPVANQTVLLRGVNDDADTLEALFRGLVQAGVKPYYLFQGDLAAGTSHFRVDLGRGMDLMRALRARMSGLALPTYAVDLPDGAGKVAIEAAFVRAEEDAYVLRGSDGAEHLYPREGG